MSLTSTVITSLLILAAVLVTNRGASSSGSSPDTPQERLFFFVYEKKRVAATCPQTYLSAVATCRRLFPQIPQNSEITFQTKDLDVCEGEPADISPESFELVVTLVTSLVVNAAVPNSGPRPAVFPQTHPEATISVYLNISGQPSYLQIQVWPSTNIMAVLYQIPAIEAQWGRWRFKNVRTMQPILLDSTFSSAGFQEHDIINCEMLLLIGKPVIYLTSPREIEATIRLSLIPQWSFSAIYPVVPSKPRSASSNEEVEWQVCVHPNGDLTELMSGLDVAYLFWEAHTNSQLPISPPPSPVPGQACLDNIEDFNPVTATLADDNSVLLSVASITPYLDRALKALGLHTEARTSFITYWLPSFLKHKHVVLRFVPQTAYEKAAPLEIIPKPDNITRVFMLFQGIEEKELIDWKCAQANSAKDAAFWAGVAGVDLDQVLDPTIFRVLEWGGMEVLQSKSSLVED